jgi:hypothetical protein
MPRNPHSCAPAEDPVLTALLSGIFGYINYLVEKDRKYILDTLINGKPPLYRAFLRAWDQLGGA